MTRHLHDAHESYFQHLGFTLKVGATLILIALVAMIHGLLPFLFTHTASSLLCRLTEEMKARKETCQARHRAESTGQS